jgi:hypothetical protein
MLFTPSISKEKRSTRNVQNILTNNMNLQVLKYMPTEEEIAMEAYARVLSDNLDRDMMIVYKVHKLCSHTVGVQI